MYSVYEYVRTGTHLTVDEMPVEVNAGRKRLRIVYSVQ